jgi:hypothetical protein
MAGLIAVTVAGFSAFFTGYIWNGVTNVRKTSRVARSRPRRNDARTGGAVASGRWSWFRGRSWGFAWSDQMGFREFKDGFRNGAWRRSARHQQFALMVFGFLTGLFALILVIGLAIGPGAVVIGVGLILYVSFQTGRGMMRA